MFICDFAPNFSDLIKFQFGSPNVTKTNYFRLTGESESVQSCLVLEWKFNKTNDQISLHVCINIRIEISDERRKWHKKHYLHHEITFNFVGFDIKKSKTLNCCRWAAMNTRPKMKFSFLRYLKNSDIQQISISSKSTWDLHDFSICCQRVLRFSISISIVGTVELKRDQLQFDGFCISHSLTRRFPQFRTIHILEQVIND